MITLEEINMITPIIKNKIRNKMQSDSRYMNLSDEALSQIELDHLRNYLKYKLIPLNRENINNLKNNLFKEV